MIALFLAGSAFAASPAVEATLALPRTEPRHYVEAALALADLGAGTEAQQVADELAGLGLDEQRLVALVDRVGAASLIRLGRELPTTAPLVEQALAAADAAAHAPERLKSLVNQLGGDREEAVRAIRSLRLTGEAGVAFCVARLAEAENPRLQARLREALVSLDPISLPALFEATGSEHEHVRVQAAYALGRLAELNRLHTPLAPAMVAGATLEPGAAGDAARWAYQQMTGSPPTSAAAGAALDLAVRDLLDDPVLFGDATQPQDPGYAVRLAARLANDRAELTPGDRRARQQALLLALEAGTASAQDAAASPDLPSVLAAALRLRLHHAAQAASEALGELGDPAPLDASGRGGVSPLVSALDAPHPSVRSAAAQAILAINPQQPFAGSSRLADTLLHLASATGDDVAVVAYPQLAPAGQTAGWLLEAGYTATPANRGSDLVRVATATPDTRLLLIDMSVSLPDARETLFRLRRSPATALTPVAVLAADGRLGEAQRLADEHEAVLAIPRPHSAEATASLADRLAGLAPADWPDAATRSAQAQAARDAIAKLLDEGPSFYGLSRRSDRVLAVVGLDADDASIASLVGLGTPDSQARLLDAASLEVRAIDQRRAAADAFTQSVREHGVRLTSDRIRLQYDRYNASVTAPEETQRLLGSLLDVLEANRE